MSDAKRPRTIKKLTQKWPRRNHCWPVSGSPYAAPSQYLWIERRLLFILSDGVCNAINVTTNEVESAKFGEGHDIEDATLLAETLDKRLHAALHNVGEVLHHLVVERRRQQFASRVPFAPWRDAILELHHRDSTNLVTGASDQPGADPVVQKSVLVTLVNVDGRVQERLRHRGKQQIIGHREFLGVSNTYLAGFCTLNENKRSKADPDNKQLAVLRSIILQHSEEF